MNWPFIAFSCWVFVIAFLTFFYWIKPSSFFTNKRAGGGSHKEVDSFSSQSLLGLGLAVLLFVTCYILGAWLAYIEHKGWLWKSWE